MSFELCRAMNLSWAEYEATPVGVRETWWAFLMIERRVRNSQAAHTARDDPGTIRIRR